MSVSVDRGREFGHIESVTMAVSTMLTGAAGGEPGELGGLSAVKGVRCPEQFIAGGGALRGAGTAMWQAYVTGGNRDSVAGLLRRASRTSDPARALQH